MSTGANLEVVELFALIDGRSWACLRPLAADSPVKLLIALVHLMMCWADGAG